MLPERTADALSLWLRNHPGVLLLSRDRSTEYARGATDGAPEALQIADRFHILLNLREAVERALKRIHAELIEQQNDSGHLQASRYKRRRSQTEIAAIFGRSDHSPGTLRRSGIPLQARDEHAFALLSNFV
jgi:transposase